MTRYIISLLFSFVLFPTQSHACSTLMTWGWNSWQETKQIVVAKVVNIETFNTEGLANVGPNFRGSVRRYLKETPFHNRPWALVSLELASRNKAEPSIRMDLAWSGTLWYVLQTPEIGREYFFAVRPISRRGRAQVQSTAAKNGKTIRQPQGGSELGMPK